MPISTPPPHSPELVQRRMDIADKEVVVDIAFFGAAGTDCLEDIIPCAKSGIVALKTFLHEGYPYKEVFQQKAVKEQDLWIKESFNYLWID